MSIQYKRILKPIRLASLFVSLAPLLLFAQVEEQILPLVAMPMEQSFSQKTSAFGDTISLPIIDDFSRKSTFTNSNFWADSKVYINSTIPTGLYSIGAATFDGTDQYGFPYDLTDNTSDSLADVLTSRYIEFATPPVNLFLSFYYQAGGLGELPEIEDSLTVQFWSPQDSIWEQVWAVKGNSVSTPFQAAIVPVNQPKFLMDGFRFRFAAYGARNGSFDIWNLDYVQLDINRNASDTIIKEPAFVRQHPSITKNFTHIPWFRYADISIKDSLTFTYRRNGPPPPGGWALNLGKFSLTKDGALVKDRLTVPVVTNLLHNVDVDFKVPLQPVTTSAPVDEFNLKMRTWFDGTAEGLRRNDTVEIIIPFKNYYAYDDGTAERGYGILNQTSARLAFQFNPVMPDTLRGLFINFAQAGTDATLNRFRIAIWQDNNGEPGLPIYISDSTYKPVYPYYHNGFMPFDLDTGVFIPGSVFIGFVQTKVDAIHVGFDLNTTNATKKYYGGGFVWYESLVPGTLMIRPYFSYTPRDFGLIEMDKNIPIVYPNPAQNIIRIDHAFADEINWILLNSLGQTLKKGNDDEIDVAILPRGLYILQTECNGQFSNHKIILQ